ncbi:MAG: hypothetical protein R2942_16150 [Ignavibacteria bacterium]
MILELRPSGIHGVGVFTYKKIIKGTKISLFEEDDYRYIKELR